MTARDSVLRRVRDALADVPADETPEDLPIPRDYRRSHADGDTVALFAERVADHHAQVTVATSTTAASAISGLLAARGVTTVVIPPGFPEALLPQGPWRRLAEPLNARELDAAEAVLTTCAAGIAVTGTIVLDTGPGQGRRALTLLPDYHVCVVRAAQIVGDVPDVVALLDPTRPLTFVSGPSATSDIENNRVEGVHGPRTLDVLVVHEEPAR